MQIEPVVFKVVHELKKRLPERGRFLLAVSGGADSLALADACAELRRDGAREFFVCHVEHGIRGEESLRDSDAVRAFCALRELPFRCCHVAAEEYAKERKLSLEEAARILRYGKLREVMREVGADYIVTAHHKDDQAETVLLRLLRGTGTDGLGGMQFIRGSLARPFLNLPKNILEQYCSARNLPVCYDSTNTDLAYTRNHIRQKLLPYLEKHFNTEIREALVRMAAVFQEDSECLLALAEKRFEEFAVAEEGKIIIDREQLLTLHRALQKRVLRLAYFTIGGKELSYERTEAMLRLSIGGTGGKVIQLPGKINISRINKKIIFAKY